ncbi:hypothetical protein B0T22DRAFT_282932 [Podospora appendiculata]|uniref:Uncharacterized protein n=1 Tax=Podospora appendiculata TaxID=314037 RepID=A0AAE0X0X5_9PEZI|nr:hypothetical protein B0T22DRAFT_282932 [Podospora appendiculata]
MDNYFRTPALRADVSVARGVADDAMMHEENAQPAPAHLGGASAYDCGNNQCRHHKTMLRGELQQRQNLLAAEVEKNQALNRQNDQLKEAVASLRVRLSRRGKHTTRQWQKMLRQYLENGNIGDYSIIYRQCCKEENMSVSLSWIHPSVRLVEPRRFGLDAPEVEIAPALPEIALLGGNPNAPAPFNFERLPWEAQARIFKIWLMKDGLIHAFSRLDPFVRPASFPSAEELRRNRSGLKTYFYWGRRECNITEDGKDPNDVLHILFVSKRFCWIGVHCFYGLNTFAFSSLGEWQRFGNGIGDARLERLQHIELTWRGQQYFTVAPPPPPPNPDPRKKCDPRIPFSYRTFGLSLLPDCRRLRTLVVHVNEGRIGTKSSYGRRQYEPENFKEYMRRKTAGQPNQRMSRSLRNLQGMDYIYTLRGLDWIRFYDLDQAADGDRVGVHDWSFTEDIKICTVDKVPSWRETSLLENLAPLFRSAEGDADNLQRWQPNDDDLTLIRSFYVGDNAPRSFDDMRRGNHRDVDIPTATQGSQDSLSSDVELDSSSGSESGSDSDLDSDSDSDGGGTRLNVLRRHTRPATGAARRPAAQDRANNAPRPALVNNADNTNAIVISDNDDSDDSAETSSSESDDSELDDTSDDTDSSSDDRGPTTIVLSDDDSDSDSTNDLFVRQSQNSQSRADSAERGSMSGGLSPEGRGSSSQIGPQQTPYAASMSRANASVTPASRPPSMLNTNSPVPQQAGREMTRSPSGLFVSPNPEQRFSPFQLMQPLPWHTPSRAGTFSREPTFASSRFLTPPLTREQLLRRSTPLIPSRMASEVIDITGDTVRVVTPAGPPDEAGESSKRPSADTIMEDADDDETSQAKRRRTDHRSSSPQA